MKNILLKYLSFLTLAITLIAGCEDAGMNYQSNGDYISGYVSFLDTNFSHNGGYYGIALYRDQPASSTPVKVDNLNYAGVNPFYYRVTWEQSENLYAAVVWVRSSGNNNPIVLGIYGCDTTQHCSNSKPIPFPNYTGANYNILCWADTTRKLN